jgi:hypothetical protein
MVGYNKKLVQNNKIKGGRKQPQTLCYVFKNYLRRPDCAGKSITVRKPI